MDGYLSRSAALATGALAATGFASSTAITRASCGARAANAGTAGAGTAGAGTASARASGRQARLANVTSNRFGQRGQVRWSVGYHAGSAAAIAVDQKSAPGVVP